MGIMSDGSTPFFFFSLLNQVSTFHVSIEGLFLNSLFFML